MVLTKLYKKIVRILLDPAFIAGSFFLLMLIYSIGLPYKHAPKNYITPPEFKHFTFGYNEPIADFLWIRAIQDFDFCSEKINEKDCKGQSWLFHMLNQVTELSPQFRMPYATGGIALTIIVNDYEGASKIFDKAVLAFPKDWRILGRAAYHALYEEKDKVKAAHLLKSGAENGGPFWYYTLSGRLFAEGGEMQLGEALLEELKASGQPDHVIDRLKKKLADHKEKLKNSAKK
jgi:hypothetical protein